MSETKNQLLDILKKKKVQSHANFRTVNQRTDIPQKRFKHPNDYKEPIGEMASFVVDWQMVNWNEPDR